MIRPEGCRASGCFLTHRVAMLAAQPYCSTCPATTNLVIHHRTYDNWPFEKREDLVVVCRKCHRRVHGSNRKITTRKPVPAGSVVDMVDARLAAAFNKIDFEV